MSAIFSDKEMRVIAPGLLPSQQYLDMELLGSVVLLLSQASDYADIPLKFLPTLVFPAIANKQFVLVLKNDQPIFYCSWAAFDKAAEERYLNNPAVSMPKADWACGERQWFTDWVAPFGHTGYITRQLRRTLFASDCKHSLYHRGDEKGLRVMTFKGSSVTREMFNQWSAAHSILHEADGNGHCLSHYSKHHIKHQSEPHAQTNIQQQPLAS